MWYNIWFYFWLLLQDLASWLQVSGTEYDSINKININCVSERQYAVVSKVVRVQALSGWYFIEYAMVFSDLPNDFYYQYLNRYLCFSPKICSSEVRQDKTVHLHFTVQLTSFGVIYGSDQVNGLRFRSRDQNAASDLSGDDTPDPEVGKEVLHGSSGCTHYRRDVICTAS